MKINSQQPNTVKAVLYCYEREVHSDTGLRKKDRNISNKQPNPNLQELEKQRNKANSQKQPSFYEDKRPKSTEDTEKTEGKGIASRQKVPGTNAGTRAAAAPGPPVRGLPLDSWERGGLTAPSAAKQGLSNTVRDLVA